ARGPIGPLAMPANRSSPLACFYSATLAWNQTAVDNLSSTVEAAKKRLNSLFALKRRRLQVV
ncbi:MAG: hypothetical protein ACK5XB_18250, partial [Rhodospirillales bacterium]